MKYSRSTFRANLSGLLLGFLTLALALGAAEQGRVEALPGAERITIRYPKDSQTVSVADSTFLFGNITTTASDVRLRINGCPVAVHQSGGFLAFLPVAHTKEFRFIAMCSLSTASNRWTTLADTVLIRLSPPLATMPGDTLAFGGEVRPPAGDIELITGDTLELRILATPDVLAWGRIPGVPDSIPLTETSESPQRFWGDATFGRRIDDTSLIHGIYAGRIPVTAGMKVDSVKVGYTIAGKNGTSLAGKICADSGRYRLSINSGKYPTVVQTIDSIQTFRHAPASGYFSIFQPKGIRLVATGREGDWIRLRPANGVVAWTQSKGVVETEDSSWPVRSEPTTVRILADSTRVRYIIPLRAKHPFQVEQAGRRELAVDLFGVRSNTDWIRYPSVDSLIDLVRWTQRTQDIYTLSIATTADIWGYETGYDGNSFVLTLFRPPADVGHIANKRIVIDPGHSSDPGAIGPTGFTEADANLAISLALRRVLREMGAEVIMTRDDKRHVALADRPIIARESRADLFISIHNNSLPDGVNPFTNNGTSTYYYNPHSIDLARAIQGELLKASGLPDHGVYHANLAVARPTQYPAVLVECAFMIIPDQEALLQTEPYQLKLARAIASGISSYLKEYDDGNRNRKKR